MKTKLLPIFIIAAGLFTLGAQAQTPDASSALQASQTVYSPRLPSAAELTNAAGAQGLSIDKIVQTASQMTVVYRLASGQTNTVAYVLLPAAGAAPAGIPASTNQTVTVAAPTSPAPQVVYASAPAAPQVVYYSTPAAAPAYYYDPFYYPSAYYGSPWYSPVSVNLGFGFHGGGYYRGGYGYHGGGGWHGGRR